jgi:hypothetical protein
MPIPILLALALAGGVALIFFGLSRTPEVDTGEFVQERLNEYGGVKPLSYEELELQQPFAERFLRPAIARLGAALSRSTRPGRAPSWTPSSSSRAGRETSPPRTSECCA